MIGDAAAQGQTQLRTLAAQRSFGLVGQPVGMLLACNDGLNDRPPARSQNVAGDLIQLDAGIFQHFVNTVMNTIALLGKLDPIARHIAQFTRFRRRHETGPDETVRQQLSQPLTIARIRFSPGDVLDLIRIGKDQLEVAFQSLPDRLPVDAGGFHRHMRHLPGKQPEAQVAQRLEMSLKLFLADLGFLALGVHQYASCDGVLVDIDPTAARI